MTMVDELRSLLARATPGPWQLQDGCSWRRIGTRGHDGNVLCPDTSRTDRHPDLTAGKGEDLYANLNLIVALRNNAEALLDALTAQDARVKELEGALERFAKVGDYMCHTPNERSADVFYNAVEADGLNSRGSVRLRVKDFRAARAALDGEPG